MRPELHEQGRGSSVARTVYEGQQFESDLDAAPTGLVGTIGFRLRNAETGVDTLARTTSGIVETPAGSGIYRVTAIAPIPATYQQIWDDGAGSPTYAIDDDDLVVLDLDDPDPAGEDPLYVTTGQAEVTSRVQNAPTGLTGTLGFRLRNRTTGLDTLARTTTGIVELETGSGLYEVTFTAPSTNGTYQRIWDTGGATPAFTIDGDDLVVNTFGTAASGIAYFTLAELRARFPELASTVSYPSETLRSWRAYVEERIEKACDVAFVPRTVTDRALSGDGSTRLEFPHNRILSIVSATETTDGAVDVDDALVDWGTVWLDAGWTVGTRNLTVTYTHGYEEIPLPVKEAAMLWARELAVKGPVTDRATQIPTESGGAINLATPGLLGSISGLPAVDEVLAEYRYPSFVG